MQEASEGLKQQLTLEQEQVPLHAVCSYVC